MSLIAGVDEAGRGPIAGPVVAAAVILPRGLTIDGVRDSKRLSEKKRESLHAEILGQAISVGTGTVHEDEIDRINILEATRIAMRMALGRLTPQPDVALIDGRALPGQIVKNRGIPLGDEKVHVISAASIIAKVTRDRMMRTYDVVFPEYNFRQHKGYGTREHLEKLKKYRACSIHRRSFHPVSHYIPTLPYLREKRMLGQWGERLAARELIHKGYGIVEMNYNAAPYGEIDIVAQRDNTTVFVEVKTASRKKWGPPEMKLDRVKMRNLSAAFDVYLSEQEDTQECRFDLMTVLFGMGKPRIRHFTDCLNQP